MRPIRAHSTHPYDLLLWLALAIFTVLLSRYSNIDWQVASYFHGPSAGGFPLRNNGLWLAAHSLTRQISLLLWLTLLVLTVHQVRRGERTARVQAGIFILLASAVALAVNGLLKTHSVHSCPWSLSALGGKADYFRLLAPLPANPGSGGCLPSGHAAVGFMWWPVVYAYARWRPSLTAIAFAAVMAFGTFCGLIQIMRGAHFVSHVLMTAAVTGGCTSLTFHLCLRAELWQRQPAPAQPQE